MALLYDFDVNQAVGSAGEAVENNQFGMDIFYHMGGGKDNAESRASLASYCVHQPDYSTCMGWTKQNLWDNAVKLHHHYNDMTILSISKGGAEQVFIINNKNGNTYASISGLNISVDDIKNARTTLPKAARTPGGSITFGSIVSGTKLETNEVDDAIRGLSVSVQVCKGVCLGVAKTMDGTQINTYGVGTPGAGISANTMVQLPFQLNNQELQQMIRSKQNAN